MATNVQIKILTDVKQSVDSLKKFQKTAGKSFKSIDKNTTLLTKSFRGIGNSIKGAAKSILVFAAAFAGFELIRSAIRNLTEFTTAVAEVQTILPKISKGNVQLTKTLIDVSNQFGVSAADQARSFYQIISAGITDATEANEVLEVANRLAIGGLTSTESAVSILTTAMNIFGKENLSAAKASDLLFTTVKLGVTRIEDLARSLGLILPTAQALGLSFEGVLAGVGALTKAGVKTSIAVTQLNSVLSGLLRNAGNAEKLFGEEIAEAFSLTSLKTKGLAGFLEDLNTAAKGSKEVFIKLFGAVEGARAIITLSQNNFQTLKETLDGMTESAQASEIAFAIVINTIGKQLDILRTKTRNIFIELLIKNEAGFVEFIKSVNKLLESLADNLDTVRKVFGFLGKAIKVGTIALVLFGVASLRTGLPLLIGKLQIAATAMQTFAVKTRIAQIAASAFNITLTLGLAFSIDFLIRKIPELSKAVGGLGNAFKAVGLEIKIILNELVIEFTTFVSDILQILIKATGGFGIFASVLKVSFLEIGKITANANKNIASLEEKIQDLAKTTKTSSDSIVKDLTKLLKIFEDIKAPIKVAPKIPGEDKPPKPVDDKKLTEGLKQALKTLQIALKNIGLDQQQIIQNELLAREKIINKAFKAGIIADGQRAVLFNKAFLDAENKILKLQLNNDKKRLAELQAGLIQAFKSPLDIFAKAFQGIAFTIEEAAAAAAGILVSAGKGKAGAEGLVKGGVQAAGAAFGIPPEISGQLFDVLKGGADEVRAAVKEFAAAIPDLIISLVEAAPALIIALIEEAPKLIERLGELLPQIITKLVTAIPAVASKLVGLMPKVAISFIRGLISAIPAFVQAMIDAINPFSDDSFIGGVVGGIGDFFGFQDGGRIPNVSQFQNDGAIIRASAGEQILSADLSNRLESFLDNETRGQNLTIINRFGERELSRSILNINRRGLRVRA